MAVPNEPKRYLETTKVDAEKSEYIVVKTSELIRMLKLASAHTGRDPRREYLQNIHMRVEQRRLVVVGTDGMKLVSATAELHQVDAKYYEYLIPKEVEAKLIKPSDTREESLAGFAFAYLNIHYDAVQAVLKNLASSEKTHWTYIFTDGDHIAFRNCRSKIKLEAQDVADTRNSSNSFVNYKDMFAAMKDGYKERVGFEVNVNTLARLVSGVNKGSEYKKGGKEYGLSELAITTGGTMQQGRSGKYECFTLSNTERARVHKSGYANGDWIIVAETQSVVECKHVKELGMPSVVRTDPLHFDKLLTAIVRHSKTTDIRITWGDPDAPILIQEKTTDCPSVYIIMSRRGSRF